MNYINKFLKPLGFRLHKSKSLVEEKSYYKATIDRISGFYVKTLKSNQSSFNNGITGIVFSKDRAMQLHALLASYFEYTVNPAPLFILYTFSNKTHEHSYDLLQKEFNDYPVSFIRESNFYLQVKSIVGNLTTDRIFFMTDDAIFLDNYDLNECLEFDPVGTIFSLRLGADFTFCYTYGVPQSGPESKDLNSKNKGFLTWQWDFMSDSPDWKYPLSLDATIFFKREIELMLHELTFSTPNSLESQLQLYKELFLRRQGACFSRVKYVNIHCNMVQKEFDNKFNDIHSLEQLVEYFLQGRRINWRKFKDIKATEAQNSKFTFVAK